MKKGKIIVIEGTDCSGKRTQSALLYQRLKKEGKKVEQLSFPMYETPTGKIIGGALLGKSYISDSWFPEGATHVPSKVASLYYAADRLYNIGKVNALLEEGYDVILDRYVESNMGHQGGKLKTKEEREALYTYIEELEYGLLGLPRPDITIFLHMPLEMERILSGTRNNTEQLDEAEKDAEHLKGSEIAYLELAERNHYHTISCVKDGNLKTIEEIHEEVIRIIEEN